MILDLYFNMFEIIEKDKNLEFKNIDYEIIFSNIEGVKLCVNLIRIDDIDDWNLIGIKVNIIAIAIENHAHTGNLCDETEEIKYLIQFPNCEQELLSKEDINKKLKALISLKK